jgi:glyoxylase-like metal-dependent hydrolase (beta-lactamase superfamily II)
MQVGVNSSRWADLVGDASGLAAEEFAPGVMRLSEKVVSEAERSFFYLVRGSNADCLIDGGWGFCDSLGFLRADPSKPLIAIATHSHFDHIGLLHMAGTRFGHRAEAAIFADPDAIATQALPYLEGRPVLDGGGTIEPDSVVQRACPLHAFLEDGQVVDLGGRRLVALHTPGHSRGSLSLLDEDAGLLFCADTVHDGHIWDDIAGADREALRMSHERLAEVDFVRACPGHGAILPRAAFLDRIALYRRQAGL